MHLILFLNFYFLTFSDPDLTDTVEHHCPLADSSPST